jgi:hypothetical protein
MSTSFEAPYYKKCKKNNAHKQWGRVENPKKYGRKKITQTDRYGDVVVRRNRQMRR